MFIIKLDSYLLVEGKDTSIRLLFISLKKKIYAFFYFVSKKQNDINYFNIKYNGSNVQR